DLLFVLQRLQNFTCLIEESIAERQRSGWVRLALGRSAFGSPAGAHFRSRNRVEPFLNDFLNLYHTLALSRVFQNQHGQIVNPLPNQVALLFEGLDVVFVGTQKITAVAEIGRASCREREEVW